MPPGPSNTMRIYALPLSRARTDRPALVYYLASLPPPKEKTESNSRTAVLARRGAQKLTETWTKWGNMESGWQRKLYDFGQRAQARIDYEELALRSMDPALGPKITSTGEGAKLVDELSQSDANPSGRVPLFYPSIFDSAVQAAPLVHLEQHVSHHEPKHRRKFWSYTIAAPFTAPFMLIPVVPNIPFFFVAWRAWSNYKAYKASSYLESLIKAGAIHPERNLILDEQYRLSLPSTLQPSSATPSGSSDTSSSSTLTSSDKSKPTSPSSPSAPPHPPSASESDVLLHERTVPGLVAALGLPSETRVELINAIRQVRTRLGLVSKPDATLNVASSASHGDPKSEKTDSS